MATSAGTDLGELGDLRRNKAEEEGALAILGLAVSSTLEVDATWGLQPVDSGMPGACTARATHVEARCATTDRLSSMIFSCSPCALAVLTL